MLIISSLSTIVMPITGLSGPVALGIVVAVGIFQVVKLVVSIVKKKSPEEDPVQKKINKLKETIQDIKEQHAIFMAHYQSEERVKANMEKRVNLIEQRLFSGNGRDSIETQLALLRQKVETLENAKSKRTTK